MITLITLKKIQLNLTVASRFCIWSGHSISCSLCQWLLPIWQHNCCVRWHSLQFEDHTRIPTGHHILMWIWFWKNDLDDGEAFSISICNSPDLCQSRMQCGKFQLQYEDPERNFISGKFSSFWKIQFQYENFGIFERMFFSRKFPFIVLWKFQPWYDNFWKDPFRYCFSSHCFRQF